MKAMITIMLTLGLGSMAAASDLGNRAPTKPAVIYPEDIPDPERQGGDTIFNATVIPALPYSDTGTTSGYFDDYEETCPYSGSVAPDVVYAFTPWANMAVDIDLCGSSFDTKLYVYDDGLNLVACNDDFYFGEPCGLYVSRLDCVLLSGGRTYYIVIDGYSFASGPYVLDVEAFIGYVVGCPPGGVDEGEPPLVNDYIDDFNGGCNTSPSYPFQDLVGDGFHRGAFQHRPGGIIGIAQVD